MTLDTETTWSRLRASLAAFFARRAGADVADDLVQETFLRVHVALGQLEDEQRLDAWVFRVARNVLADHFRGTRAPEELDFDDLAKSEDDSNLDSEVESWLRGMLVQLPAEMREALELADLQGLTHADVARRQGLSLSAAKSRIQRARARLREVLFACCHLELDGRGHVVETRRRAGCSQCDC